MDEEWGQEGSRGSPKKTPHDMAGSANYTSVFPCASEPLLSSLSLGFLLSVKQNRVQSD